MPKDLKIYAYLTQDELDLVRHWDKQLKRMRRNYRREVAARKAYLQIRIDRQRTASTRAAERVDAGGDAARE